MGKELISDKDEIERIVAYIRATYQTLYTGYDTWIEKSNVFEHIVSLVIEHINANGKLESIGAILVD